MPARSARRPTTNETFLGVAALALLLALPAVAEGEAAPPRSANWTVFLSTGSTLHATEVHHDKNRGRHVLRLPNGGTIMLPDSVVRRVSREPDDKVAKAAPVVAVSTGSPRPGAAPGSVDTSSVRPAPLRSAAVGFEGESLQARTAEKLRAGGGTPQAEAMVSRGTAEALPQRGQMERMLRRVNGGGIQPRPRR